MRTLCRNLAAALLFWGAVFAAFFLLFLRFAPEEALSADSRRVLTVLTEDGPVTMTMANYLPGALAAEMPLSFGPEALKAQAVAARTYAMRKVLANIKQSYDLVQKLLSVNEGKVEWAYFDELDHSDPFFKSAENTRRILDFYDRWIVR